MIPLDLYNIRQGLNLTKQDLDNHLEVEHGTVNRWELKKEPIPRWASLAIRYLATDSVPQEGDWDFEGPVKPRFSLPVYPSVDVPELQERPSIGRDIPVFDDLDDPDRSYTEEERMILWRMSDNVRTIHHHRPRPK